MKINKTDLVVKASVLEEGLVEEVVKIIEDNPRLFDDEKVVLMADAHKTCGIPVGFTMTLSKGLIPVDYVSADMFCGVSAYLIEDYVPTQQQLKSLSYIIRDLVQVNRRFDNYTDEITDFGTIGNGNHFLEIGTNGKDTLISVHSGSRNYGGDMFKKHKKIAIEHTKEYYQKERKEALDAIEPKERQNYLKSLPKVSNLPLLDTKLYPEYWIELSYTRDFAMDNRVFILDVIAKFLGLKIKEEPIDTVHNYVDTSGKIPVVRKGSIKANEGDTVLIPINMKDGIIVGKVSSTEEVNYSLPHGAGRVLSRSRAFNELDEQTFVEDMRDVVSATVGAQTLDESPRAYKSLDVILKDIEPYLSEYEIFKSIFNYKGVD